MDRFDADQSLGYGHGMADGLAAQPGAAVRSLPARFDRLFKNLPAQADSDSKLRNLPMTTIDAIFQEVGQPGGVMDEAAVPGFGFESTIPAGYTFLGQFIDHDVTLETRSRLDVFQRANLGNLQNVRTPDLELDSVYGLGPDVTPFLYQQTSGNRAKFLIGESRTGQGKLFTDLPRNQEFVALIGDPRNDENTVISQLHLAFLKFHNRLVDELKSHGLSGDKNLFESAYKHVNYYYHKIIIDDFLPRIIGPEMVNDLLNSASPRKLRYYTETDPTKMYMPVEFSGAAYRYGHSQVRESYVFTDQIKGRIFDFGPKPNQGPTAYVQWKYFFEMDPTARPVPARVLDTRLPTQLLRLPFITEGPTSLATRNLMRGWRLGLPSGQSVAQQMVADGLIPASQKLPVSADLQAKMAETPLWFYILQEAKELGGGNRLGPVGGRIVGEVIVGLMKQNPYSPLTGTFSPTITLPTTNGKFLMPNLLTTAMA